MDFIRFTVLPFIKTHAIYWWWVIRYGGKQNIPPDVIFDAIEKSLKEMRENLDAAIRIAPENVPREETLEMLRALQLTGEIEKEIQDVQKSTD